MIRFATFLLRSRLPVSLVATVAFAALAGAAGVALAWLVDWTWS